MSLEITASHIPGLISAELLDELRAARAAARSVVVLAPSYPQALELSRGLAAYPELSLGITCTTVLSWVRERWEVWGDGRTLADPAVRNALCYKLVMIDEQPEGSILSCTAGTVRTLASLVKDALAWLPADPDSRITLREQQFVDIALRYGEVLSAHGFIEPCQASDELPRIMAQNGVEMPEIFAVGFADAPYSAVRLLADLSALTQVHVHVFEDGTPQTELARLLVSSLSAYAGSCGIDAVYRRSEDAPAEPAGELQILTQALFRAGEKGVALPAATGAVSRAQATGPFAEPELLTREVLRLSKGGAKRIVVCGQDAGALWDSLAPRLAARGLLVQGDELRRLDLTASGRAFIAFASCVAQLAEAAEAWDSVPEGELAPMSWWPPRAITDFLLSSISGVGIEAAWALDKRLRGNRGLTPRAVLDLLQRESATSHACAQAVRLLLEGRIGSAAHQIAGDLVEAGASLQSDDVLVLEAIAQMQASLSHLGLSAAGDGRLDAATLAELLDFMCSTLNVRMGAALGPDNAPATVSICSRTRAAQLAPASVDALVFAGLTSAEWPLKQADGALALMLEKLGLAIARDPLAEARQRFSSALRAATGSVVLEMSLHDRDAKATYPAVVLSELLACYPEDAQPACTTLSEDAPASKLSATGTAPGREGASELPAQDYIQDRTMLVLPRSSSAGDMPLALSATQIETYLDCPLKWFTHSRIKIDGIDADFGGMQKGSFAHVVLERTHRELLRRAAVAQGLIGADDPVDALTALHVPGARVTPENLDQATALLDAIFDEHLAGQRERALRKESQSLVPHTESEKYQVDLLRRDLHAVLAYESERLAGFEPRFFELRFGRGEGARIATYAGAEFVGTIDRIDVDAQGNAVIIDYKHKSPLGFAAGYNAFPKNGPGKEFTLEAFNLPRHIQTLAYAQIIRRIHPELKVVGAVYLSTQGPVPEQHVIAGLATYGALERMLGERAASTWENAMCPPDGAGFDELLDAVEALVAKAIANLAAAQIPAEPRDAEACRFCPVQRCERRLI